ncbi:MAG: adenylate/guanylate cyclase domain-containing protein [Gallionella sp.]|nr:adenylate/guanylate cyclase domain-containing protein [Gallionella sp.]
MTSVPPVDLLIVDSGAYTRSLLLERLSQMADCTLHVHDSWTDIQLAAMQGNSCVLVLNHHVNDAPPFEFLQQVKKVLPQSLVVVISSPGAPHRALELCNKDQACIDMIFDKPIDLEHLGGYLSERITLLRQQQLLNQEHLDLLRFLPTAALRRIFSQPVPGKAELFDMTVMFTDIRDSTQLIVQESARNYFAKLNRVLASQARLIRLYEGMVVKTTGDGLLAVFEGGARCHMALKCASAIQSSIEARSTPVGIGLSDGLVLTGILGTTEHLHFDVIGAHVHLAARLCSKAAAGEILATRDVSSKARFEFDSQPLQDSIVVRGFDAAVPCIHIKKLRNTYEKSI